MRENIIWHDQKITRKDREDLLGQKGKVIWLTGLSGSGKSTIASELAKKLHKEGFLTYILDGDNIRHGLNRDLGFSDADRKENIRRVGEVASLLSDCGIIVIVSFISPFLEDRKKVRKIIGRSFIEVFVDCPFNVCEKRDPKGLYKKARNLQIKNFTGIDSKYEPPDNPEIRVDTSTMSVDHCVKKIKTKISQI